jgi:hypothetical protein
LNTKGGQLLDLRFPAISVLAAHINAHALKRRAVRDGRDDQRTVIL